MLVLIVASTCSLVFMTSSKRSPSIRVACALQAVQIEVTQGTQQVVLVHAALPKGVGEGHHQKENQDDHDIKPGCPCVAAYIIGDHEYPAPKVEENQ